MSSYGDAPGLEDGRSVWGSGDNTPRPRVPYVPGPAARQPPPADQTSARTATADQQLDPNAPVLAHQMWSFTDELTSGFATHALEQQRVVERLRSELGAAQQRQQAAADHQFAELTTALQGLQAQTASFGQAAAASSSSHPQSRPPVDADRTAPSSSPTDASGLVSSPTALATGGKFNKPPTLDLTDRDEPAVRHFINRLNDIFRTQSLFTSDAAKVSYALGFVGREVDEWARAEEGLVEGSWETFASSMAKRWGAFDPHHEDRAAFDRLSNKGGKTEMGAFITKFNSLARRLPEIGPSLLAHAFLVRLPDGIIDRLAYQDGLMECNDVAHLQRAVLGLMRADALKSHVKGGASSSSSAVAAHGSQPGTTTATTSASSAPVKMDVDAVNVSASPPAATRGRTLYGGSAQRIDDAARGACFFCHKTGHLARGCPEKPKKAEEEAAGKEGGAAGHQ